MLMAFGDHELDLPRQELRRRGEVVRVEPQVFDLLVLLIENRDRIVSKDEILDRIWDGRAVSEAALSSRINAARRAVGDSGEEQRLIRTHHKRGFRFIGEVTLRPPEGDARARLRRRPLRRRAPPGRAVLPSRCSPS
jgi:DNA-binding winged helix-turn-helix (wHTH) protein